jgi:hypothetical protein
MVLPMAASFSAYPATVEHFSFSTGGGLVSGSGLTSCGYVSVSVYATRSGTHNLSAPSSTGLAYAFINIYNSCTGASFFEYGSTTNFQFSAPGTPNVMPQSVTASGVIPMSCTGTGCPSSDNLTFSMVLKPLGTMTFESAASVKTSYATVTTDEHFDTNSAFASGPVTVSSQSLGTIVLPWFTEVSDEKTHTVTISY